MEYLDAYLLKEKKKRPALFPDFERPEQFADTDGEVEITFLLLPSRWLRRPKRLTKRLARMTRRYPPRGQVWYEDRLQEALAEGAGHADGAGHAGGLPHADGTGHADGARHADGTLNAVPWGLFWMARFYREQPFRDNLIVLLPDFPEEEPERILMRQEEWMREFLGKAYEKLNGLLLVSTAIPESVGSLPLTEKHAYYEHIYQDTGLPVIGVGRLPDYSRGKASGRTVCVDAGQKGPVPFRSLPEKTIYLDMTSDPEKARLLHAKRGDVCYRSLRMYLDTFVRKRYNTNRCK